MPSTWNIFMIGRKRRDEDQLTEMLVWLISAVPEVGRALVSLALGDHRGILDGDLEVTTQHGIAKGRLDALVLANDVAMVVESKIDSGYGDDQLERYLEWLAKAHGHRTQRALMTLTARPAPWSAADRDLADELGIVASEHLWEDLQAALEPLAEEFSDDQLAPRLTREFLDMLGEEGLVPMKPLNTEELGRWSDAWTVVERFHEFFDACKAAVGVALGATPIPNSSSKSGSYTYQDFLLDDGSTRIVVGLNCSDQERVPRNARRRTPILWVAVEAKHWPDWEAAKDRLDSTRPENWNGWHRWWGERPQVWRYLDDVLGEGSFDKQRERLAKAASETRVWVDEAAFGPKRD